MEADNFLLSRYATSRDAEAFAELVRRYAGMVYAVARRATGSATDAEDVAQLCFLELAKRAGAIHGSVAAWLHKAATHRAADAIRNRQTRSRHERAAATIDPQSVSDERAELDAIVAHVDEALAELPDELRLPLIEHYLRGRSQADLAADLGVNQSTVSRRLKEGVEHLRSRLTTAGVVATIATLPAALVHGADLAPPAGVIDKLGKLALSGVGNPPVAAAATAKPLWFIAFAILAIVTGAVLWPLLMQISPTGVSTNNGASMPAANPSSNAVVRELKPLLFVKDINQSIVFYRDKLGFEVDGKPAESDGKVFFCGLKRQGCALMLQQAEQEDGPAEGRGRGVAFYFICDDADKLYAELTARGLKLESPKTAYYGMRQVTVPEPDGYALCFESPIGPASASSAPAKLKHAVPTLPVTDAAKAQAYYVDVLGFKREFMINDGNGVPHFCGVSRDGVRVYLSTVDVTPERPFRPGDMTLAAGSKEIVDALFAEFKAKGATIKREPRDVPWGREFIILDPDGNAIVVGVQ